jgi:uncharacterized membrane protein (DUF485 family)
MKNKIFILILFIRLSILVLVLAFLGLIIYISFNYILVALLPNVVSIGYLDSLCIGLLLDMVITLIQRKNNVIDSLGEVKNSLNKLKLK